MRHEPTFAGASPKPPQPTLLGHSASHSERLFLPLSGPCSAQLRRARVTLRYTALRAADANIASRTRHTQPADVFLVRIPD